LSRKHMRSFCLSSRPGFSSLNSPPSPHHANRPGFPNDHHCQTPNGPGPLLPHSLFTACPTPLLVPPSVAHPNPCIRIEFFQIASTPPGVLFFLPLLTPCFLCYPGPPSRVCLRNCLAWILDCLPTTNSCEICFPPPITREVPLFFGRCPEGQVKLINAFRPLLPPQSLFGPGPETFFHLHPF